MSMLVTLDLFLALNVCRTAASWQPSWKHVAEDTPSESTVGRQDSGLLETSWGNDFSNWLQISASFTS